MMHPFKRACLTSGCPELVEKGRCPRHTAATPLRSPQAQQWHTLYNDRRWRSASTEFRKQHPLCTDPYGDHGPLVPTQCVDHIQAHRGNVALFWDMANWQSLCIVCNSKKAATTERR